MAKTCRKTCLILARTPIRSEAFYWMANTPLRERGLARGRETTLNQLNGSNEPTRKGRPSS
jgi:hypothetical protein